MLQPYRLSGSIRSFTTRSILLQQFLTPDELVSKSKQEQVENQQFQSQLRQKQVPYSPKTLSSHTTIHENHKRPIPLNVELLQYKPLRLPQTHGDKVATLNLRGYNDDDLIRMGEFALRAAYYLGIPMSKLTSLKTEKRLYTVIKSPFAQAKTKQNFHRTTYNKQLVAYDANPEVVDLWLSYVNRYKLNNVDMKATVIAREGSNYNEELAKLEEFELPQAYEGLEDPVAQKVKELLQSNDFKKAL
ncbi:RSM10 [Candida margitis]|uniref:RSM10 n=1 Tax=Candida margitis TaxID=1775924 RepID=UPI0022263075|nr:RSM10 [Candida margitis]KAI5961288.1 RSM10 [Candida margitis]